MKTLYKRNAKGKPIFWNIKIINNQLFVNYGLVNTAGHTEAIRTHRKLTDEMASQIKAKRKEGYKSIQDLYDNAPESLIGESVYNFINTYLPKFNTNADGNLIPMLCKTLEDNRPFEKGSYFGQWKINGERCIITAELEKGIFERIVLKYRSREGIDWTEKLNYLDDYILPCIPKNLLDMMIEEGVALDGELYLPGYGINEINSFIKNTTLPQHYKLQYWLYDICIENMSAWTRQNILESSFDRFRLLDTISKEGHLNNTKRLIYLYNYNVADINEAIKMRDTFISLGFEGLVIREKSAEYQFGGRRNNSMLKFKKKEDGLFKIVDIVPEGIKRSHLPKFICQNDINDELFTCTFNAPQSIQEDILRNKDKHIGSLMLVEYRERSGQLQVPFHAKGIKIK